MLHNVGWQYRWFTVDAQAGTISYYLCDTGSVDDHSSNIIGNAPRGQAHLANAVVCPSDEDSRTFTISCASGDTLKLRSTDARARQEWVDGLRAISECHTLVIIFYFCFLFIWKILKKNCKNNFRLAVQHRCQFVKV